MLFYTIAHGRRDGRFALWANGGAADAAGCIERLCRRVVRKRFMDTPVA